MLIILYFTAQAFMLFADSTDSADPFLQILKLIHFLRIGGIFGSGIGALQLVVLVAGTDSFTPGFLAACSVLGIGFGVFQLVGAIHYNVRMLATCLIFHLFSLAFSLYYLHYLGDFWFVIKYPIIFRLLWICPVAGIVKYSIVFSLLWVCPIAGVINEINKGIMSKETYPCEAHGKTKVNCEYLALLV